MAVYTEVSDEDLAAFIATYDLGELLSCKGIAEGVENTNYMIHTEAGPYILTLYEKRVARADLPFFLGLMEHLAGAGLTCPLPVRDRAGAMLRELEGRPAAVITFLEGVWLRKPRPQHCQEVGATLAKMHLCGRGFTRERRNALSVDAWRPLYESFGAQADTISAGLSGDIRHALDALESTWPGDLPRGIVHADLFPDNVLFLRDEISGFIDFYFACNDMLAYDLAVCLNAWCFEADGSFNVTKSRGLLNAYARVRPLETREIEALPILARGAALRFLLTRAYDWINTAGNAFVRPKDPMEYARRLRFHNRVATARDYGLEIA